MRPCVHIERYASSIAHAQRRISVRRTLRTTLRRTVRGNNIVKLQLFPRSVHSVTVQGVLVAPDQNVVFARFCLRKR